MGNESIWSNSRSIALCLCLGLRSLRSVRNGIQGKSKIWDAAMGTPVSAIPGHRFTVPNDFSTVASSEDKAITFYNVNGSPQNAIITTLSTIQKLAFSSESNRVAAALSDGTVWLWNSGNTELIGCFNGSEHSTNQLQFSPTGTRLAYSSANGVELRDGISGRIIAYLRCGSIHKFEFSGDGFRIASVSHDYGLTLWNSENGGLIAAVRNVGRYGFAISANGSLLAIADANQVTLWSENCNHLAQIKVLEADVPREMAFSLDNILAITTTSGIRLYNVKIHSFIHTLPLGGRPIALAFSPDGTRLACGSGYGSVYFWDIRGIDAFDPPSKVDATAVTVLTLSRDCSRLACGFEDGRVELWGTSPTKRRIDPLALRSKMETIFFRIFRQARHTESVRALGFDPDGRLFASGSDDGGIKLWNGGDGALRGTLKVSGRLRAVALSNSVLVATWGRWHEEGYDGGVTLWSLDTLTPIHTFKDEDKASKVSIAENSTLIAVCLGYGHVALLDAVNHITIATFYVPYDIHTMTFLPDNSHLVIQSEEGIFSSIDLINKDIIKGPTFEHLVQLLNTPLWYGVPIWHCHEGEQHFLAALISQHKCPIPVLWIPKDFHVTACTHGSSMIALGCRDGRVILLRLLTKYRC